MNVRINFDGDWLTDVIESAIKAALEFENVSFDSELEVVIADPEEIQTLNMETRGIDRVTDVLSFPMFDSLSDVTCEADGFAFLGSMVICKERAVEQATEYGHSIEREAAFLAVHSVLHLLGYDHETGEEDERVMFSKQEQILEKMGLTR